MGTDSGKNTFEKEQYKIAVFDYDETASNLLRKFFDKTDEKIVSAEYINKSDIKLITEKDGERNTFIFNIDKGQILSGDNWKEYFN